MSQLHCRVPLCPKGMAVQPTWHFIQGKSAGYCLTMTELLEANDRTETMNVINSKQLLGQLNWRYATKQFDPNRKISDQDWATIEQALLLTPSSGGLQPWKFIVVTDPAVRGKLLPASYGQAQIADASHRVVFAAKKNLSEADVY